MQMEKKGLSRQGKRWWSRQAKAGIGDAESGKRRTAGLRGSARGLRRGSKNNRWKDRERRASTRSVLEAARESATSSGGLPLASSIIGRREEPDARDQSKRLRG